MMMIYKKHIPLTNAKLKTTRLRMNPVYRFFLYTICLLLSPFARATESVELPIEEFPYSFHKKPYVNARIVEDLSRNLKDSGDQVVSVNLLDSQRSSRYYMDIDEDDDSSENSYRKYFRENGGYFHYSHVGRTDNGIDVLCTMDSYGGSGSFRHLLFVEVVWDYGLSISKSRASSKGPRKRLLIRVLDEKSLGDRWHGDLKLRGNTLYVGKDEGWFVWNGTTGNREEIEEEKKAGDTGSGYTLPIPDKRPTAKDVSE